MASYKLYYFPIRGRGEPIRLLFTYKGIQYEDIRVTGEEWSKTQVNMPFGTMPVLEEDGKQLGSSNVILRYLAEKPEFNVAGSNAWENAWLANIGDFIKDFHSELIKLYWENDEEKKKELQKKFAEEIVPKYLGKLNEMSKDTGYLCYGKLTWPDLFIFNLLEGMGQHKPEIVANFPGLVKLKANVENEPNIAKWLAERPKTDI